METDCQLGLGLGLGFGPRQVGTTETDCQERVEVEGRFVCSKQQQVCCGGGTSQTPARKKGWPVALRARAAYRSRSIAKEASASSQSGAESLEVFREHQLLSPSMRASAGQSVMPCAQRTVVLSQTMRSLVVSCQVGWPSGSGFGFRDGE